MLLSHTSLCYFTMPHKDHSVTLYVISILIFNGIAWILIEILESPMKTWGFVPYWDQKKKPLICSSEIPLGWNWTWWFKIKGIEEELQVWIARYKFNCLRTLSFGDFAQKNKKNKKTCDTQII